MSCELGGQIPSHCRIYRYWRASSRQAVGRLHDFNQELAFILNFVMIMWTACPWRLSDELLTTIEDKPKKQWNFIFTIDDWLLISLKDSNMQATVTMKIIMFIKLRLVWAIYPIWWIGCFGLILCDLTWPNCLDNLELTLLGRCFV